MVRLSRDFYAYMESDGGAVPWGVLGALAGSAGLGALVGLGVSQVSGSNASDLVYVGVMIALAVDMALMIAPCVVVVIAHLKHIPSERKLPPNARRARR